MTISNQFDRVKFSVSGTPGTGAVTVGSAVTGFRTPAGASIPTGTVCTWLAVDGTAWEVWQGAYTSAGTSIARTTLFQSSTGAAISLTSAAVVALVRAAEDPLQTEDTEALALKDGTTATALRIYNTTDGASVPTNYERGVIDWAATSNVLSIGTQKGGTGSTRSLQFVVGGVNKFDYGVSTTSQWTCAPILNAPSGIDLVGGLGTVYGIAYGNGSPDAANGPTFGGGFVVMGAGAGPSPQLGSGGAVGWSDATKPANGSALDTRISRKAAGVLSFDTTTTGDSLGAINARTKAGAPTTSDVPAGTWVLIRDTTNSTTKIYYNNAGALMSVALT